MKTLRKFTGKVRTTSWILCSSLVVSLPGCGSSSSSGGSGGAGLPIVTPIVKAAAPSGLKPAGTSFFKQFRQFLPKDILLSRAMATGSFTDLADRFFTGTGPSDLFTTLLPQVDGIINSMNSTTLSGACLTQTPVAYSITPFGQTVQMVAQCYSQGTASYTGDPAKT